MKINMKYITFILIAILSFSVVVNAAGDGKYKKVKKENFKAGDAYRMNINNFNLPLNKSGVLGDVLLNGSSGGTLDGKIFLFSGGFFMSGLSEGHKWANAVASASRIQDYNPGTYAIPSTDNRVQLYVVSAKDGDFAPSWNDWKDAVALGANFYDGDGDGVYNPVDKNNNHKWDPNEDRPDLIGDETVWCVYSDNVDPALRSFNDVDPQGIEIRQTVFGFNSKGVTGNMVFVRYELLNTGKYYNSIDSVYFSVWADPDLGDPYSDLVGCDTTLNAGYVYNSGPDAIFGKNPPCFLIDFFQGPIVYVPGETFVDANGNGVYDEGETAIDTAIDVKGQARGITKYPGAKNLGLSSFVHYQQSDPDLGDPSNQIEARYYMLGTNRKGLPLDPCTWKLGSVMGGVDCKLVNNKYWYSGDPVTKVGWINNTATDQRLMLNTGSFKLVKGQPVTITAAYVLGQGTDALNSITIAKQNDVTAQKIFDKNFPSPPPPPPLEYNLTTGEDFIDIDLSTATAMNYHAVDTVLDVNRWIKGFYITQYMTNSKAGSIEGITNSKVIASYDMADSINGIYTLNGSGGLDLTVEKSANQLDSAVYADPSTGRIKLRVNTDAFTGGPLVKGKEYYFTLTQYTLNNNVIYNKDSKTNNGRLGDYVAPGSGLEQFETAINTVTFGQNLYDPALQGEFGEKKSGVSDGAVKYLVADKSKLTGNDYQVSFMQDKSSNPYAPFWRLTNNTTGQILIDSSKVYDFDTTNYAGTPIEGMLLKVKPVNATIDLDKWSYTGGNQWFDGFRSASGTAIVYPGKDITAGASPKVKSQSAQSNVISADRLRTVELRFGTQGKAYRYVNAIKGSGPSRFTTYAYAGNITANDIAKIKDTKYKNVGQGYVDVPFTAWVKDTKYGEERQLAVGFTEMSSTVSNYKGNPDGVWDPGDSVNLSNESIVIFDAPYDVNGQQPEYIGIDSSKYSDLVKSWNASTTTMSDSLKSIAASPWFNAMYVVSLQKNASDTPIGTGTLTIPMGTYPYTNKDVFKFNTSRTEFSASAKNNLFNKINVYPNPLFAYNPATSYSGGNPDEPFVTFSNLPEKVTIRIYTLSGTLVRTLTTGDKASPTSPFLRWNLQNESGLRVASGMYLATVECPGYGQKVLKFAVIMPQKQIQNF